MDEKRIQKLQQRLEFPVWVDQLADLLYLTGLQVSRGRMWVTPQEAVLFVDGRYFEKAKKLAPCTVLLWDEQKKISAPKMGFDRASVSYETFLEMKNQWPQADLIPMQSPVKRLRAIKDATEIAALKKGAALTRKGIEEVVKRFKVGVTEEELALEFEFFCRRNGASGMSFQPIIAFGENSAYPHYRAGKSRLRENQIVLIDVGAVVDEYHADMTRVFHFGKVDPELLRLEEIVKGAQKLAIEQVKPGIFLGLVDQVVHDEFVRANVKQLYIHNLGHGVGLETHEFPQVRFKGRDHELVLEAGMVFTIEPGLYQPGLGGIRWEDMILVTENGHASL